MEIVSSSGSFLSSFLIFLLLEKHTLASGRSIYFSLAPKGLSSGLSVEQFSVIGPTEPIRAWVGRTADLPCYLSPQKNAQSMKVIWFQSLEIVHHYEDGQDKFDNQSPKFQGRTELVKDAISRGNVTLRIWNITAADKGHYKCHFDDGLYQEEAGIELLVSGIMEIVSSSGSFLSSLLIIHLLETHTLASEQFSVIGPTERIRAWVGRTADLPCYLSPQKNAQAMKVIWFQSLEIVHHYEDGQDKFDDQSPKFQGRTELVKDAITRGNVTLRIWNITASDQGHYKCHFDDGLYQEEAGFELFVSGEGTEQQIHWWSIVIDIFIDLLILTVIIFAILFLLYAGTYTGEGGGGA
uniref:Myelin-oligodendrocyte glycoprotein-like n=2 Tax=Monodelphis domestica TaxID=13616 RepID=A0A5F8HAK9_MONDO